MKKSFGFVLTMMFGLLFFNANAQRITLPNGQTPFFSGMNVAWRAFGGDAADTPADLNDWKTVLDKVKAAGGNTIRWWLFVNCSQAPKFDGNGYVSGLGSQSINNIKAVLDLAKERNMVIILCLFSFDMLQTAQWGVNEANNKKMLQTDAGIKAAIDNAVVPLVKAIGKHPSILCWEIFNEPEGMTSFGWTPSKVGMYDIQRFVNRAAGAIHKAVPGVKVSNGSWNMKVLCNKLGYINYYSDAELKAAGNDADGYLDFYMVHYYNNDGGNNMQHSPFHHPSSYWGLDKPILVAEFAAKGVDNPYLTPQDCFQKVYDGNYAGALSWTYTAHDGLGGLPESTPGIKYLYDNHKADVTINFAGLNVEAGANQLVYDVNLDGKEQITLDGSGSTSSSGTISYVWKENGQTIGTTVKPSISLGVGVHNITLTVSDNVNPTVTDNVIITIKAPSLSYKKPITVSSTEVGVNVGNNAVDGDSTTRWASLVADPQSITVNLQAVYSLSSIDISWEFASAKNYIIEVSTDGTTWKNISTKTGMTAGARIDSIKGLTDIAQYVRITGTARTSTFGYSIFEFEVWGEKAISPTSITLNKTTESIEKGLNSQLIATILPANATDKTITWKSSNTSIATVDANGVVTAKSAGNATITATTNLGGIFATCSITAIWNGNYVITAKTGANGTITPEGAFTLAPNASKSFNITPAEHYMVESIKIDGASVATASSYTFSNVSADHTIEVSFAYNGISAGLCNKNAIAEASSLMSFMRDVYGKYIISGQCNEKWLPLIQQTTGDQPAILALDFDGICPSQGGNNGAAKAIDWVKNKGGIVQFQWHWISPDADGDYYGNWNLGAALANKNGQSYKNMLRDIDLVAGEIKKMQDAGVPIIFRPLHESEGAWFWWGKSGKAALNELYHLMYDRYTNYFKLNNIVWLWNSYGSDKGNWYPGDDVCDIIAWDYESPTSWQQYQTLFGNKGKLFGLAEEGKHPDPNNFAARPWSFFITWDYMIQDPSQPKGQNPTAWTKTVYSDPKTITLNGLKKFNVYNRAPLNASAGSDQLIFDVDMNGTESVTLDASTSSSNTSNILLYEWRIDGITIATGVKPTLSLKAGMHKIALVVSDGKNNPAGDEIIITIKNPSLAYLKPVTVSSTEAGFGNIATNANDGYTTTRWSSLYTDPQWIYVDLQDTYNLTSIILNWEVANAKNYIIDFSIDGQTWSNAIDKNAMATGLRIDTIGGISQNARYVRISGTARNTNYGYSLFEIEVYGTKQEITQTIQLQQGWNLISFNVSPTDKTIETVFKNVLANVAEIKTADAFWFKGQNTAFNSLKSIKDGSAYLVKMNATGDLTLTGTESTSTITNTTLGWQMIGCPYQTATQLSSIFNTTNCNTIKNFDGFWYPNGATNSILNLEPGKGYFILK